MSNLNNQACQQANVQDSKLLQTKIGDAVARAHYSKFFLGDIVRKATNKELVTCLSFQDLSRSQTWEHSGHGYPGMLR